VRRRIREELRSLYCVDEMKKRNFISHLMQTQEMRSNLPLRGGGKQMSCSTTAIPTTGEEKGKAE